MLLNLISNACQAMGEQGGEIAVNAEIADIPDGREYLLIRVADNGGGIGEAIRENIFEPFFTTRENGTGLGLAIVKQLVESHDGYVWVDSVVGEGSVFTFSLPLPPTDRERAPEPFRGRY